MRTLLTPVPALFEIITYLDRLLSLALLNQGRVPTV